MQKDIKTEAPSGRPQRQPVGFRNRLVARNQDPNYVYRFVNDTDDRIEMFKEAGYEPVTVSKSTLGDKRLEGSATVDKSVSVGGGTRAYLMRIQKDWYEEDQKKKQQQVDSVEDSLKSPPVDGSFGKLEISRK